MVRTAGDPGTTAVAVQQALRAVDPTVAVENVMTLDQIRGDSLASRSFAMQLLIGFALVACVLTLGGIYGMLSLSVASRRREIAIRTAVALLACWFPARRAAEADPVSALREE